MLIKKIFRGVGVSLNLGFSIVVVLLGLLFLYYLYSSSGGVLVMVAVGGGVMVALIKGFFDLLTWLGQPSRNDADNEDDDDYY